MSSKWKVGLGLGLGLAGAALWRAATVEDTHAPGSSPAPEPDAPNYISNDDGVWIHVREWKAEGASKSPKSVVFLVHGIGEHMGRPGYTKLGSALARAGHDVFALDHQGHGLSGGERGYVRRFDDFVRDVNQVVAERTARYPKSTPTFLFGHSMGSLVVTRLMMAEDSERFRGVVLSGLATDVSAVPWVLRQVMSLLSVFAPKTVVDELKGEGISTDPSATRRYLADPLMQYNLRARLGAEIFSVAGTVTAHVPRVRYPFLLLHGSDDSICNINGAKAFHDGAASADKGLVVFEGGYHELFEDAHSDKFVTDTVDWITARAECLTLP